MQDIITLQDVYIQYLQVTITKHMYMKYIKQDKN